jgi:hypothetical protein
VDAVVDLADPAVSGNPPTVSGASSPSATNKIGILGIPTVNLAVGGNALTVFGTPANDTLNVAPIGPQSADLTRSGSAQLLHFTGIAGLFTVDPRAGTDSVGVSGTPAGDTILAQITATTTVQVGASKIVTMPLATMERLFIHADDGQDFVTTNVLDDVNAFVTVVGDDPSSNPNQADKLRVHGASLKAKVQKQPSPVQDTGSIFVSYPQTTNNVTRVDYTGIEKLTTTK